MSQRTAYLPQKALADLLARYRANQREIEKRVQWPSATPFELVENTPFATTDLTEPDDFWTTLVSFAPPLNSQGSYLLVADAVVEFGDVSGAYVLTQMRFVGRDGYCAEAQLLEFPTATGTGQFLLHMHEPVFIDAGESVDLEFFHGSTNFVTPENVSAEVVSASIIAYPL